MAKLIYRHEGEAVEVSLGEFPVSLGRGDKATHPLPDKGASRLHAQVFCRDGAWLVEDLGSANGTLLNGKRIEAAAPLKDGDVIRVGHTDLLFEQPEALRPKPRAAEPPEVKPKEEPGRLIWKREDAQPLEIPVAGLISVGRKADNTLQIDDKRISSHHCEVVFQAGEYVIRDLGSSNGTWINKQRVDKAVLYDGDVILLGGKIPLEFRRPATVAPPEPDTPQAAAEAPRAPEPRAAGAAPEPRRRAPVAAPAPKVLPFALVGAVVAAVLVSLGAVGGHFLAGTDDADVGENGESRDKPPSTALSFEGDVDDHGNPQGWEALFESAEATQIELFSDPGSPGDGERSLRLTTGGGSGLFTLRSTEEYDFGGCRSVEWRLLLRGRDTRNLTVSFGVESAGETQTLAVCPAGALQPETWQPLRIQGMAGGRAGKARIVLRVVGSFHTLWIDRLEFQLNPGIEKQSFGLEGDLAASLDASAAGRVLVDAPGGEIALAPRVSEDGDASGFDPTLWGLVDIGADKAMLDGVLRGGGEKLRLRLEGGSAARAYVEEPGVRLEWRLDAKSRKIGLEISVTLPLRTGDRVFAADLNGGAAPVDREEFHSFAYATVSEVYLEDGVSLVFPRGAVVWFDFVRKGEMTLHMRPAAEEDRKRILVEVFPHPLAPARLLSRVMDEAVALEEGEHYSAALARYAFLLDSPKVAAAVKEDARARMKAISDLRDELRVSFEEAYELAVTGKTLPAVEKASRLAARLMDGFPGDAGADDVRARADELARLRAKAIPGRTGVELARANEVARGLLATAQDQYKAGHILMALVALENILRDYRDTVVLQDAETLHKGIRAVLDDPARRDAVIDAELARIDQAIEEERWAQAMEMCEELFRQFPDTPRNRDIMLRVRRIEDRLD